MTVGQEASQTIDRMVNFYFVCRKYKLRGMVVHSGQASGGHYYSYIKDGERCGNITCYIMHSIL